MDTSNPRFLPAVVLIGGGLLVTVGSFLPWITATLPLVGTISRSGLDGGGDGLLSLGLGVLLVVSGFAYFASGKPTQGLVGGVGLATLVLAGFEWQNVTSRISDLPAIATGLAQVGGGIYVIGAGAIVVFVSAWMMDRAAKSMPPAPPPGPPPVPPTPGG